MLSASRVRVLLSREGERPPQLFAEGVEGVTQQTKRLNFQYAAPEVLRFGFKQGHANKGAVAIFSFGAAAFELLVGEPFYTTLVRKHRGLFSKPSYEDVRECVESENYTN